MIRNVKLRGGIGRKSEKCFLFKCKAQGTPKLQMIIKQNGFFFFFGLFIFLYFSFFLFFLWKSDVFEGFFKIEEQIDT